MSLSQLNPHIRFASHFMQMNYPKGVHYCYDCRLFFIQEGNGALQVDHTQYDFSDHMVLFVPGGTGYRFRPADNAKKFSLLVFDFDLVSDYAHLKDSLMTVTPDQFRPEKIPAYPLPEEFCSVIVQSLPDLYEPLKKCTDAFLHRQPYYRETASALLKWSLLKLIQEHSARPGWGLFPRITNYIHRHYHEPALTNRQIAEEFGYHPYHLSRLMKEATGESLHQYLLHYRLRMAKNALISTDRDISTISWQCGFNSPAYFIKQFKAQNGLTPLQYRRSRAHLL